MRVTIREVKQEPGGRHHESALLFGYQTRIAGHRPESPLLFDIQTESGGRTRESALLFGGGPKGAGRMGLRGERSPCCREAASFNRAG